MRIFEYLCPVCQRTRLFTEREHEIMESLIGCDLRERRWLRVHIEPTPSDGGPAQFGNCLGIMEFERLIVAG